MTDRPVSDDALYLPYDDALQPPRSIDGYPRSQTRTPSAPLVRRPVTLSESTGPVGLDQRLRMGPVDLARLDGRRSQAIGQYVSIRGQVLDEDRTPVAGAILELWQANGAGRYPHEADGNDAPLDSSFTGSARIVTDAEGRFGFRTIKSGAYPVPHSTWEWRAPHIHVSLLGRTWMSRLVTQLFFPGEYLNGQDLLLTAIPDEHARSRLVVRPLPTVVRPNGNILEFEHDIVLRGRRRTPSVIDHDEERSRAAANLTTGPFFPPEFLEPELADLTRLGDRTASGERIVLTGRVLEEGDKLTINTIVEIWQADATGRFRHPADPKSEHSDPGFPGWGRANTGTGGTYRLNTIFPGAYEHGGALRCPHINVMLLASGILRPLVTTVFFGDPAGSPTDPVLAAVPEPSRGRLFAVRDPAHDAPDARAFRFDIVLRGEQETPFFLD